MWRVLFVRIFLFLLWTLAPVPVAAQSHLFDGVSVLGHIEPNYTTAQYLFDALTGEQIRLRVLGLNGLDPMLTVLGPDGAEMANVRGDACSFAPRDTLIMSNVQQDGSYTVIVRGENETSGDFLLQFEQEPPATTALLPGDQTVTVPVQAAAGPIRLQFASAAQCPTVLTIQPSNSASGSRALVNVLNEQGALVGQLGANALEQRLIVGANSGLYVAEIVPLPDSADGSLTLTVSCAAAQPACREAPANSPVTLARVAEAQPALLMVQPGGVLNYSQAVQGEFGQSAPRVGYSFSGARGDEVIVQVTDISLGFNPDLSLLDPSLATIGSVRDSPGTFRPTDAILRVVLPEDGCYTALVGSANDATGAFLIRLLGEPIAEPVALAAEAPLQVEAGEGGAQRYQFTALDSCPTALHLEAAGGATIPVGVVVRSAAGDVLGEVYPSAIAGLNLVVPAASGAYDVLIQRTGDAAASGLLTLSLSCQLESPACSPAQMVGSVPPAMPTVTLVSHANAGSACHGIVSVASANVRRGDTTNHFVVRALPLGTEVEVIGLSSTGSGWFRVITPQNEQGWMSPAVLTVEGETASLPRLQPPPAPVTAPPPAVQPVATLDPGANAVCGNGWCEGDEAITCCGDCGTCAVPTPEFRITFYPITLRPPLPTIPPFPPLP